MIRWLFRPVFRSLFWAFLSAGMLPAGGPAFAAERSGLAAKAREILAAIDLRLDDLVHALAATPSELTSMKATVMAGLESGEGVRATTSILILLLIGGGIEWFYWTYAIGPFRLIEAIPVRSPRHAVLLGLRRLGLSLLGVLAFAMSTLIASTSFTWPPGVESGLITAVLMLVFMRLGWLGIDLVLAPHHARLRLVPMETRRARTLSLALFALVTLLAGAVLLPDFLKDEMAAGHAATSIHFAAATLSLPLLISIAASHSVPAERRQGRFRRLKLPSFPRWFLPSGLVITVYLLWLLQGFALSALFAIILLMILGQLGARPFILSLWQDRIDAADTANAQEAAAQADPLLIPNILISLLRLALIILGLGLSTIVLDIPVTDMAMSDEPIARFVSRLMQVAAFLLLAHLTWTVISSSIHHRLRMIGPVDPHGEPGPNARLLTLLPLLRTTAAVGLVAAVILATMWALGIEITPLLAGAGVLGLALGFGAQALVRDVIAGVFYLVEDVFRIGEYIESGPSTKGTVEHITLRTVALRHHNGPLHFVPYGALGTVRNTSRDWVIDKFNLPLPVDVDSEKVRKILKKVGEDMLLDPEIGPLIVTPLKGKLYRVDPGVKLFRCRFETAPGKQFDVRAEAYKRIEAKLKEAGIAFANSSHVVFLQGGESAPRYDPRPD